MESSSLTALVVEVYPDFEVALNVGSSHGIQPGATAIVLRRHELKDPASGAPLGIYKRPILTLNVHTVEESFCVAGSVDTVSRPGPSAMPYPSPFEPQEQRRVTNDPELEDWRTVYVPVGAEAQVHSYPAAMG